MFASNEKLQLLGREPMLLGPLSPTDYQRYMAIGSNDSTYALKKIVEKFSGKENASALEARAKMWTQYSELLDLLNKQQPEDILATVQKFILSKSEAATSEYREPRTRLGAHLQEIQKFSTDFFLTAEGESRFGESILSKHHAQLVCYLIAPLHDLLKYLGPSQAQVVADHEIMAAELVRRCFEGKTVLVGNRRFSLNAADVAFISGVIGDHENLEKELGRREWIKSKNPIERAKALFTVADTLTAALVPTEDGKTWLAEPNQIHKRFTDLYFRHIDLVKGKIFRPEWGLYMIGDLASTLSYLSDHCAFKIFGESREESIASALKRSGLQAIEAALIANQERRSNTASAAPIFSDQQKLAIENVREKLNSDNF